MSNKIREFLNGVPGWVGMKVHPNRVRSVVFDEKRWEHLNAIRKRDGLQGRNDVIAEALQLYDFMSRAADTGPVNIVVDHGDSSKTWHEVFPKR